MMQQLSRNELLELYKTVPVETLQKLGVYDQAKEICKEEEEKERLKQQRLERAKALVEEAQEILNIYRLSLRVSASGRIRFVDQNTGRDMSLFASSEEIGKRRSVRSRAPSTTSTDFFELPILQTLSELGGKTGIRSVLSSVYGKVKDQLSPTDHETLSSGVVRWEKKAAFARLRLVQKELLRADSPRGVWEISEEGRKYLEQYSQR